MLQTLLIRPDTDTKYFAADSLLQLYGREEEPYLEMFKDSAIDTALEEWRANRQ